MNILLVDDDEYIVRVIRKQIDWDRLEIEEVYAAYNIRQAQDILRKLPVQIMVCDIEMPQGSGLDLLEWVRRNGYDIETIFLTSFAQFQYAQRALALKSLNYYLKPLNCEMLEKGLAEAVEKVREKERQRGYQKESRYWKQNKEHILQNFFRKLIARAGDVTEEEIEKDIEQADLPYTMETAFLPLWIRIYDDKELLSGWEDTRVQMGMERLAALAASGRGIQEARAVMVKKTEGMILLISAGEEFPFLTVANLADKLSEDCRDYFQCENLIGIGCECSLPKLGAAVEELRRVCSDNVMREHRVVSVLEYEDRKIPYHLPAIHAWEALLKENRTEELVEKVEAYLEELKSARQLNREILKLFRADITQLVYTCFRYTQIWACGLLVYEKGDQLFQHSVDSIPDMMNYVRYLAQKVSECSRLVEKTGSVAETIREYIDQNYDKEITRSDLAEIVYLNPDYISRVFKKEMGISISAYLMGKRIETARELLESTNMPANVISMHVGYDNYSYFSRMFHENTGESPNEYRKRHKRKET